MSKRNKTNKNSENDDHEIIWLHLKDSLVNYGISLHKTKKYWKSNACTDWNITSYDESLSRRQFTSKRSCHIYMGEDLDRLANAFINTKIMREVSRVRKQLSNAKKDVINNYFWDNHAIALQQDIVDRQRSQTKLETSIISIESSLMSQHSKQLEQSSISTKRLQESSPASTSSKKRLINLSSSTSHLKIPSLSEEKASTRLSSDSLPSTSNPLTETENSPKHATDTSPSTPSGHLSSAPKLNDTPPSLFSPTKSGLLHSPVPILETNAMSSPPPSQK
ncbi:hypothetical protein G6F64_010406 [Rhizopus arrhizus]|uniref:Uncharacterized protein n=1 Tax=Rhizopus oryzae TaxID=64495 RepID=A0A9P6X1B2_RHIOR|nr:hypothetical protein G6F64_010406 [Rhizopus arrhizus]